ncbi:MAG: peptidylprolyl isomerase [Candidatus Acidiferrum sp.]
MNKSVRNTSLAIVLLFAAPLLAQNPPAQNPPAQNPAAQAPQQPQLEKPQLEKPSEAEPNVPTATAPPPASAKPAAKGPVHTGEGKTVEEIIARVNNEIITKSELDKARASAEDEARQECANRCTPEQLQVAVEDAQKYALRGLIDNSLLAQRGKDMGVSVEADVVKQLDQIRIQNKLADMDELEKAVTAQGINWDDFKNNIRNRALTQLVVGREVGSHITITAEDCKKYYEQHKSDFVRPEQVALAAIELKTEGKTPAEVADIKKKADEIEKKLQDGEEFAELAKRRSDGATAQQGGYLGTYKRGELSKELEDQVFVMKKKQITPVIETKQGFLILQVLEHYTEGEQPYEVVQSEIQDKLYSERIEPAVREYLKTLREQSYVIIKPGYQDMAGGGNSEIEEVSATPEEGKNKKPHKKYYLFGKPTGGSGT